jgi:hypothetical protein
MTKKDRKIIESLDWGIYDGTDFYELEKYSPLGEDFCFSVSKKNYKNDIIDYVDNFDYEEHAEIWIENRGRNGTPSSIQDLLDDAKAIKEMLIELVDKLCE